MATARLARALGEWAGVVAHEAWPARWLHSAAATARHARVLDGRAVAAAWQEELAHDVRDVYAKGGRPPGLGVVLVGARPDSLLYVTRKREACERVGMFAEVRQLSESVTQRQLEAAVAALCADPRIDGVLVQLPLPRHIDEEAVIESFDPQKDVDGFHPLNMGRILMRGRAARFIPCTALGVIELLQRSGVAVRGRSVVVMGDSNVVGMPLAMLFRDAGAATVTVLHRTSYRELFADATSAERASQRAQAAACLPRIPGPVAAHAAGAASDCTGGRTLIADQQVAALGERASPRPHPYQADHASVLAQGAAQARHPGSPHPHVSDLPGITRTADILVVAVGYPQLVRRAWVKPGAAVIDVGINVVGDAGRDIADDARVQEPDGRRAQLEPHLQGEQPEQGLQRPVAGVAAELGQQQQRSSIARPHDGYSESGAPLQQPWHVVGDVDFEDVADIASALTPVPGGVGPMTIAAVLHNTIQAARYNLGLEHYSSAAATR